MERIILIKNLSPFTATRARGQKAHLNLVEHLRGGESVILDLRGQELISISFLDEIILRLKSLGFLEKVDRVLICACKQTAVLSLAINWILLQLAKVVSFVGSLTNRKGPAKMGCAPCVKSGGSLR